MTRPLDPDVQDRVAMVIDRARRSGANLPTRLNDAGLLWTKQKETKIYLGALRDLQAAIRIWMPHEHLRTVNRSLVNCTPTEMYQAILDFIGKYIAQAETERK